MNQNQFVSEISRPDFDLDRFVSLIIQQEGTRVECLENMLHHEDIMVYYHCYYVIAKASQLEPGLFYKYWDQISTLLGHKNSYHRDFALTILANLVAVDHENRFSAIFLDYMRHIHDEKFMTAICCIQNLKKILPFRPDLTPPTLNMLLQIDDQSSYSEKQKALIRSDILEIIEMAYESAEDKQKLDRFILASCESLSPKTRKKAKELFLQFGLSTKIAV